MLTLFSRHQDAGVVGTRIVSRFGALEEAGGILAADGSRRRRGEGDQNPDRPEYCFVKRVDFCSPPLLATRSEVFRRNGGFDEGLGGPADAMVDFSLRAGQMGTPVYYQPQARVVKIGEANR
jgi:GT2 family glycosyltransferase